MCSQCGTTCAAPSATTGARAVDGLGCSGSWAEGWGWIWAARECCARGGDRLVRARGWMGRRGGQDCFLGRGSENMWRHSENCAVQIVALPQQLRRPEFCAVQKFAPPRNLRRPEICAAEKITPSRNVRPSPPPRNVRRPARHAFFSEREPHLRF